MGMFDSLYVVLDGKETEVQTKRFDCALASYRLGDCVDGATPGVRVYFDLLDIDASGKLIYGRSDEAVRSLTLFIVIAHGVFVEYSVSDGRLEPPAIHERIRELRDRWRDSARLVDFLVGVVRDKQQAIERLNGRIARATTTIASARRLRAGEQLTDLFGLVHEQDQRLTRGDDLLDVVEWALGSDALAWGLRSGAGASADSLADYRL
ncbi:MAG: hypothetical protein WAM94_00200 [Chromatiaceae bacterium]